MIDAALVERYVRDANPIPHVDDLDAVELAHAVAVTYARRETAIQTPTQIPTFSAPAVTPPQRGRAWAFALAIVLVLAGIGIIALVLRDGGGSVTDEPAPLPTLPETQTTVPVSPTTLPEAPELTWSQIESLTWSRVPEIPGLDSISDVTRGGPGLVAIGTAFWASEDGMTWTQVHPDSTVGSFGDSGGLAVGGPGLVAVGTEWDYSDDAPWLARAAVWTSPDGITWTRVPHDEQVFGPSPTIGEEGMTEMRDVTVGGPGLIAVGTEISADVAESRGVIWHSADGLTWSRLPADEEAFGGSEGMGHFSMKSVTAGGPGLVAVGVDEDRFNGAVWTSPDGLTWSRVPHDEDVFGSGAMMKVIAGGPGLVAIGEEEATMGAATHAAVWTSPDGFTWSRVPHDEDVFGFGPSFSGDGKVLIESVIDVGGGLIAVGSATRCEIDWETEPFDPDQIWYCHHAVVWTSPDGLKWSRAPHNEEVFVSGEMRHVIAGGPGLVALGDVEIYPDGPGYIDGGPMVWVATPPE